MSEASGLSARGGPAAGWGPMATVFKLDCASVRPMRCVMVALTMLVSAASNVAAAPGGKADVIGSIAQFFRLSSERARESLPVRMEGMVLYSDSHGRFLWFKNGDNRLYLALPEDVPLPPARKRVLLTGKTALVDGSARITEMNFEILGPAEMPPPVILMPLAVQGKAALGHRVSLAGTVVDARAEEGRLRLIVAFLRRFQVRVFVNHPAPESVTQIIGAHVEVVGSPSRRPGQDKTHLTPIQIYTPDFTDVAVFRRGPAD